MNNKLLIEYFKDNKIKVVDKDFYIKSQMKSDVIKYITLLAEENESLNNIIYELEEVLEREIKIGEELFSDDNDKMIVCRTLKQVLKELNKLREM